MKAGRFEYVRARSVEEACALLSSDEDAKVIAGGQSLIPMMNLRLAYPSLLVDLCGIPGLQALECGADGILRIGALVTHAQVEHASIVAAAAAGLPHAIRQIAHPQIRSRGTVCGSLCHADTAAEWPLLLMAYGGAMTVQGVSGPRTITADDLFLGQFSTSLEQHEVATAVSLPVGGRRLAFEEVSRRTGDYGLALVAATCDDSAGPVRNVRMAVGGAVGMTSRVPVAEVVLEGNVVDRATAALAAEAVASELEFLGDINGSSDYRRHIVRGLVERVALSLGASR